MSKASTSKGKRKRGDSPDSNFPPLRFTSIATRGGKLVDPCWSWVTTIDSSSEITLQHALQACNLGSTTNRRFCVNKYAKPCPRPVPKVKNPDVIEIDDTEEEEEEEESEDDKKKKGKGKARSEAGCSKTLCKNNPYCLNYLLQDQWENDFGLDIFVGDYTEDFSSNPVSDVRNPDIPVGLRNLGATCYANASLQVWNQDLAFRSSVFKCQPSLDGLASLDDSPLFQLQVTFAALQSGPSRVFDPVRLVDSLRLRRAEQQDAQEFSKLFMSLLAGEFAKQEVPALRSLIADQFQGSLIYGTQCHGCQYRSERNSDFLELEISLTSKCTLAERLEASLQSEVLNGDNQYHCSNCDSKHDATRYTELRKLPPVLHFSIQRFVFDFETFERKKSKQAIKFPPALNMALYCRPGPSTDSKLQSYDGQESNAPDSQQLYELRGVLVHKGGSAYHGHYEAQVLDVIKGKWFRFNDEEVTEIPSLHGLKHLEIRAAADLESEGEPWENLKPKRKYVKKGTARRVIPPSPEMSDEPLSSVEDWRSKYGADISSKDCYCLIYSRVDPKSLPGCESGALRAESPDPLAIDVDIPSQKHEDVVMSTEEVLPEPKLETEMTLGQGIEVLPGFELAAEHPPAEQARSQVIDLEPSSVVQAKVEEMSKGMTERCALYTHLSAAAHEKFYAAKEAYRAVYSKWEVKAPEEPFVIVSRAGLVRWLNQRYPMNRFARAAAKGKPPGDDDVIMLDDNGIPTPPSEPPTSASLAHLDAEPMLIGNLFEGIVCAHHGIDPKKVNEFKIITPEAWNAICKECKLPSGTGEGEVPGPLSLCLQCLKGDFEGSLDTSQGLMIVNDMIQERSYRIQHPNHVNQFEKLAAEYLGDSEETFYISKTWLKEWKMVRPKFHEKGCPDPAPDQEPYIDDVLCEHGVLGPTPAMRTKINGNACSFLLSLFGDWSPIPVSTWTCDICTAATESTRPQRVALRQQIEAERLALPALLYEKDEIIFSGLDPRAINITHFNFLQNEVRWCLISTDWVKRWRLWVGSIGAPRPPPPNNKIFLCEHGDSLWDFNSQEDMLSVELSMLRESVYSNIQSLYGEETGPYMIVKTAPNEETGMPEITCDHRTCEDCRQKRRAFNGKGSILLYILGPGDPDPLPGLPGRFRNEAYTGSIAREPPRQLVSAAPARRSKRNKEAKTAGSITRIEVDSHDLGSDLRKKIAAQESTAAELVLIWRKEAKLDDKKSLQEQGVLLDDILEVKLLTEEEWAELATKQALEESTVVAKRKPVAEGPAFGGTLLGGA